MLGWSITLALSIVAVLWAADYLLRLQPANGPKAADASLSASLRLNGGYDPSRAGELVAAGAGLFEAEGLHIEIRADGAETDPAQLVSNDIGSFGITGAANFLAARERGAPFVAFAAAYVESPVVFYVLKKSGIRTPYDFIGKRIQYQQGRDTSMLYQALMDKLLLSRSGVHEVHVSSEVGLLVNGAIDIWPEHIGVGASALTQQGIEYSVVAPANYGLHIPGTVYFTTEETIRKQPELVRRFLRAVIAGWQWTYAHESSSIPMLVSYNPTTLTPAIVELWLEQQREFLRPLGARFCEFDNLRWRSLQDVLVQQKTIKHPVDLSSAVTFEFLRDAYQRAETLVH